MKKRSIVALALASLLTAGGLALAAETETPKPIEIKDKVHVKATVEAIDHTNRTVDLKGPKGNILTLSVEESVTRFDKMKVGDVVSVDYLESVVYQVEKAGTPTSPDTITDTSAKRSGEKPGGAAVAQIVTTVTIEAIDLATPAITVRTSDGAKQSFRVRDVNNLKGVKVGDKVKVTETAALMIAVDAPQ